MASYLVLFLEEGTFDNRDALWWKARVYRDRQTLGIVLGIIDALSWGNEVPDDEDGIALLDHAAVLELGDAIRRVIVEGSFRDHWEQEAVEIPLDVQAVRRRVYQGTSKAALFEQHTEVISFEHD